MIKYLQHNKIDKQKWDACITNAENTMVYAMSWYLDIVSPNWDALVLGDYQTVMPLTWRKKWGVKYIYIPPLTQQLGVFFLPGVKLNATVDDFIAAIPKIFRSVSIKFNYLNSIDSVNVKSNNNFLLHLNAPYDKIYSGFSKNHKKNIKSSINKGAKFGQLQSEDRFLAFFKKYTLAKDNGVDKSIVNVLQRLILYSINNNTGFIYAVLDGENKITSATYYLKFNNVYYQLASATSPKGRKSSTRYYLLNEFIKLNSSSDAILDFEGSNVESIAYFNKGFGVKQINYYSMYYKYIPLYGRVFK